MTTTRDELRKLAEAATPGPWVQNGRNGIPTPIGSCVALTRRHDDDERRADAEFIAAARTALPTLLDQLDAAEARIKAVQDVLDHHPYGGPGQEDAIRRALKE